MLDRRKCLQTTSLDLCYQYLLALVVKHRLSCLVRSSYLFTVLEQAFALAKSFLNVWSNHSWVSRVQSHYKQFCHLSRRERWHYRYTIYSSSAAAAPTIAYISNFSHFRFARFPQVVQIHYHVWACPSFDAFPLLEFYRKPFDRARDKRRLR